jgi:ubiquinone/menaquinone biosynthesis C-methylase UbiE
LNSRDGQTDWAGWLSSLRDGLEDGRNASALQRVLDRVIDNARLGPGDRVLDLGAGTGLLTFRAARAVGPGGEVTAVDSDPECIAALELESGIITPGNVVPALGRLESLPFGPGSFDAVVCRSALVYAGDLRAAAMELSRVVAPAGRFSVFEPLPGESSWRGEVSEEFIGLERSLEESGGPRAVDRVALREAFERSVGAFESLPVHFGLSMEGRDVEEVVSEYLYDLPGRLGALSILKNSLEESKIVETVRGFARAASAGRVRGSMHCMFVWGPPGNHTKEEVQRAGRT